jgi:ABC-type dipeptide/oligopeptide/nickel transport system permease component
MLRHALHRIMLAFPVMFGVLLIGFLLMQVVPTDPATVRAGPTATPDVIAAIRADLGLDAPLHHQFALYMGRLVQGDLGVSIINNVPVTQELSATIVPTLE